MSRATPKFSKLEVGVMKPLWDRGACSVREIHEAFPAAGRPAFTTVQTTVYRLEAKGALKCTKRISNANIFEAVVTRTDVEGHLFDELLSLLGGRMKPFMARLVESGRLTLDDIREAEQAIKNSRHKRKPR